MNLKQYFASSFISGIMVMVIAHLYLFFVEHSQEDKLSKILIAIPLTIMLAILFDFNQKYVKRKIK